MQKFMSRQTIVFLLLLIPTLCLDAGFISWKNKTMIKRYIINKSYCETSVV
jgi:hypothetical protein